MQVDSITIPVGPRLGDKVVEVSGLNKAFGDRLLLEGASFSVPPGGGAMLYLVGTQRVSCVSASQPWFVKCVLCVCVHVSTLT